MNTKNPFNVEGKGVVSPKGKALWCKNVVPDTTYDPKGELSVNLILDPNDAEVKAFLEPLEVMRQQAFDEAVKKLDAAKAKGLKMRDLTQPDIDRDGKETGNVKIKFKLGKIQDRKDNGKQYAITTVDAKKNKLANPPTVGNGSVIRCSGFAFPYYMASTKEIGISITWNGLQILELVERSDGADAFGVEEGGYEVADAGSFEEVPF